MENNLRQDLIELIDYDLWANEQWAPVIDQMTANARVAEVWSHILRAQVTWYDRSINEGDMPALPDDVMAALRITAQTWKELMLICDVEAYVSYKTNSGDQFFSLISDVVRHLVNHGTFHRGELRAYAATMGVAFPETDYILWKRLQPIG
jgi:uncharacterized damage-inducible protein DinB